VEGLTGGGPFGERYIHLAKTLGVELMHGEASFIEPTMLQVGAELVSVKAVVVTTGSEDYIPEIKGLSEVPYATSRTLFTRVTSVPKSVVILGGGPVGCEYATFFAAVGSRVTIVQSASRLLPREDADVSAAVQASFEVRGVEVLTGAEVVEAVNGRGVYGLRVMHAGKELAVPCNVLFIAAGKRGGGAHLHLPDVGIATDDRGFITTDATGRTSQKTVFAAGDSDGGYLFTHTAHREGTIAGTNAALVAKGKRSPLMKRGLRVVPRVTFTDPEVASVGMTEVEAKATLKKVLVGQFEMRVLGRSVTDGNEEGFVKLVAHPKTGVLLGAHVVGPHAGEIIHEASLAISLKAKIPQVANAVHAYPTYSEALGAAAEAVNFK
jgi:pyruvate/2-oxoglutarate dehydrogenase complex dihydrolipoamide dehydrogenase (E3) component